IGDAIAAELEHGEPHVAVDMDALQRLPDDPHELQRAVRTLLESRKTLEEWDRRKDDAFASLAHELTNPLQAVISLLHLLDRTRTDPAHFGDVAARMRH